MTTRFFMLDWEAVSNGLPTESYCKAGGFTTRSFIIESILEKSGRNYEEIHEVKFVDLFHI